MMWLCSSFVPCTLQEVWIKRLGKWPLILQIRFGQKLACKGFLRKNVTPQDCFSFWIESDCLWMCSKSNADPIGVFLTNPPSTPTQEKCQSCGLSSCHCENCLQLAGGPKGRKLRHMERQWQRRQVPDYCDKMNTSCDVCSSSFKILDV